MVRLTRVHVLPWFDKLTIGMEDGRRVSVAVEAVGFGEVEVLPAFGLVLERADAVQELGET